VDKYKNLDVDYYNRHQPTLKTFLLIC